MKRYMVALFVGLAAWLLLAPSTVAQAQGTKGGVVDEARVLCSIVHGRFCVTRTTAARWCM
jgi:hypothetical protein